MWILECDGDLLQHKRLWLRPGKKYLFGRTKSEPGGIAIENKSISRKHLTIAIDAVRPGDGTNVFTKTSVTVEDQQSKIGTLLDGEQIRGRSKKLDGDRHEIQLGSFAHIFRVKWQPVVFSFSFSSKEQKRGDPLIPLRTRLEPLDIKFTLHYIRGTTTHVVASKRNTAKGLEALINARYIVTDAFIDDVVDAAQPNDPTDIESLSRFEEDFDVAWPDALQYLPAQSREPSQRPSKDFAPDEQRGTIFEGYTFVFCDQLQFDNLQAPITNGGGKALLFPLVPNTTSPEEIVRYVKNAAGEKGDGEFEDGSNGQGVVVVRFRGGKDHEEWAIELGDEVARKLDQRLIEQSEFLDAILIKDASTLRKSLPEEEENEDDQIEGGLPAKIDLDPEINAAIMVDPPSDGRLRSRRLVTSRFKGFDEFDDAELPPLSDIRENDDDHHAYLIRAHGDAPVADSQPTTHPSRSGQKRRIEPSDDEGDDDMFDRMLPAAAAMKRRRLERQAPDIIRSTQKSAAEVAKSAPKKVRKEIDVREAAREHREAEDEASRREQENLQASLEGMDLEQMQHLAVIETMAVTGRKERVSRDEDHGSRWDERWNGRKNFKKFKKRGEEGTHIARRGRGVIVGFDEVQKKHYGIGDHYWVDSERQPRKDRHDRSTAASLPSQSTPYMTARSGVESEEATDSIMPQVVDGPAGKRIANKPSSKEASQEPGVGSVMVSVPSVTGKRTASSSLASSTGGIAKKQRTFHARDSNSDGSDEDALKFRFKRKR